MENSQSPAILGFYGFANSGKTTLILRLIQDLAGRGIRVGVVKITDQAIHSEPAGKDTNVFRSAGAVMTSFSSAVETNFVIDEKSTLGQIIAKMVLLQELDLVIVEGANDPDTPKIRLGEKPLRENTLLTYTGDLKEVENIIAELLKEKEQKNET